MTKIGNAGEHGTEIDGDVNRYLIDGYLPTIGIECHVQLNTNTKLFSSVDNDAREAEPNSKVSTIDYALPGMLPVLNRGAIVKAVRAGKALGSQIAHESRFDRKHYFYPDLPKGYQISQMYQPLIIGGRVDLPTGEHVRIHHAHVEEDAGKLTHYDDHSLVDLNRAGTPLIEIVAEPDIHSAVMARAYAEELHLLMTYADVTIGDLYHGNMRFDVNISVAKPGEPLGTRTELKNINSFRAIERAVDYEIRRQIAVLKQGGVVEQQTRGWSDAEGKTTVQRSKENAQDYRYMPDADIPPVVLTDADIDQMQADFPIMPAEYRAKFSELNMDESVVRVLLSQQRLAVLINEILETSNQATAKRISNLFASCLPTNDGEEQSNNDYALPSSQHLIELANMLEEGKVSSSAGKEIFAEMLKTDDSPMKIAEVKKLLQVSDEGAVTTVVDEVINDPACAKAVADFKAGEEKVIGFLVGQVMKKSKGQANPSMAQQILRQKLQ